MALRVARGLFRLWLVLSVLWIGGVGVATWRTFPIPVLPSICDLPANERSEDWDCSFSWLQRVKAPFVMDIIQDNILLALVPPIFVLALGLALVWAFRGFRN
jgi:hypothetical protein